MIPDERRAFDSLPHPLRHTALDGGAGAAEGDQERTQVMHRHMLEAMQEKHVLRPVIEPGLQHGIDQSEAESGRRRGARSPALRPNEPKPNRDRTTAAPGPSPDTRSGKNPTASRTAAAPDGSTTATTARRRRRGSRRRPPGPSAHPAAPSPAAAESLRRPAPCPPS